MMSPHIDKESAVPWWAAFGAPLVGVPLMVAILALAAPEKEQTIQVPEDEASWVADEVEADLSVDRRAAQVRILEAAEAPARC